MMSEESGDPAERRREMSEAFLREIEQQGEARRLAREAAQRAHDRAVARVGKARLELFQCSLRLQQFRPDPPPDAAAAELAHKKAAAEFEDAERSLNEARARLRAIVGRARRTEK